MASDDGADALSIDAAQARGDRVKRQSDADPGLHRPTRAVQVVYEPKRVGPDQIDDHVGTRESRLEMQHRPIVKAGPGDDRERTSEAEIVLVLLHAVGARVERFRSNAPPGFEQLGILGRILGSGISQPMRLCMNAGGPSADSPGSATESENVSFRPTRRS